MAFTLKEITEATGGKVIYGNHDAMLFTGVSIDSRTIRSGDLFVALKGERFDGHNFLVDALRTGSGALVSIPPAEPVKGKPIVYVKNSLKALQNLARYERMKRKISVIGVTGTNGKTTTKELIASILSVRYSVLKNSGNLNNHIGLPLSLLKIEDAQDFAVLEMGASLRGDIKELCDIAAPDFGVITNIGPGHLEGFGSIDTIRDTKLELLDAVNSIAVNTDDLFLMEGVLARVRSTEGRKRVVTFGIDNKADVYARDILLEKGRSLFTLFLADGNSAEVTMDTSGRFNIYNALAAASVCNCFGVSIPDIKEGIESFKGVPMRLEIKGMFGATVISDVYNANPASMEEAVKELIRIRKRRAIAVLGDMLELGSYSEEAHRKLGKWLLSLGIDLFIAVGPMMSRAAEEFSAGSGRAVLAEDSVKAREILLGLCDEDDTILVKGSRGMNMEKVIEAYAGKTCKPVRSGELNAI